MKSNGCVAIVFALVATCFADWQFRSRPDLAPPRLNITVPAHPSAESGYIFIAQYNGFDTGSWGPEQPGAYIFRDNGDLVWSSVGYLGGWITNFAPIVWKGKLALKAFEGILDAGHGRMYGKHSILNEKYEIVKTVRPGAHRLVSCHEFRALEGGTVLVETPVSVPIDLKPWGGDGGQNWIVSNGFQEIDIETGDLVFEWYSLDHTDPKYSAFPLEKDGPFDSRNSTNAWNYFHINSVDKNDQGDYLISARNYAAIFKISGKTGKILWQLGGKAGSNFTIPDSVKFAYQHDARFLHRSADGDVEVISFFDNAAHSAGVFLNPFSRARIVKLTHSTGKAEEVHTYPAPDGLSAHSQGNAQVLPNGNIFVNWGQAGAITEFSEEGKVLFHSYLDSEPYGKNVQSYRGFRFNWTGLASEDVAIVALRDPENESEATVYVSRNGDNRRTLPSFRDASTINYNGSTNTLLIALQRSRYPSSYLSYQLELDPE
ncbi:hypothetical protein P154DRAFT_612009 [Amniculicola lignicola CBS 123094]|uniref:Arylsulfotransferase n=1 Tax=Amniculicola lignicola CBS 123094 TaxID=1392246 RepID=A0A6A5W083_9PLEO|nr:hypothetical protein P154DRAFT_612009 [Amniculicola lignicola CBS 123094]